MVSVCIHADLSKVNETVRSIWSIYVLVCKNQWRGSKYRLAGCSKFKLGTHFRCSKYSLPLCSNNTFEKMEKLCSKYMSGNVIQIISTTI